MEYAEFPAPQPLDELVHCFWFLRGDLTGAEPQTVVPDGRLEIILHLAEPFSKFDRDGAPRRQSRAILSGQLTSPIRLVAGGIADLAGIRFRTAAAGAVLRVPLAELTDQVDDLSLVSPMLASTLHAAASAHDALPDRVAALSAALMRFVRLEPDPFTRRALRELEGPENTIGGIATRYGVSSRTIERRMLEATGLPPSVMRRVIRFRRAFRMLEHAPTGTWGRVAAAAGYFDQAHLIRDFRQFAGATPREFFNRDEDLARAILGGGQ